VPVVKKGIAPYDHDISRAYDKYSVESFTGKGFNRADTLRRYEENLRAWLKGFPEAQKNISNYHGKRLGCNCGLLQCHGDIILKVAAEYYYEINGEGNEK
jgi:Domain of unknown function (DUF4326)